MSDDGHEMQIVISINKKEAPSALTHRNMA